MSRCHLYLGIGLYLQSHETETRDTRVSLSQAAAKHLLQVRVVEEFSSQIFKQNVRPLTTYEP